MEKRLKICHIGWAHSMHVKRITQWFARKSHDISIITNNPQEIDGIKVYDIRRKTDLRPRIARYKEFHFNINWKLLNNINSIIRIRKLVHQISPDIIHSHSLWYPGYLGVYIKDYPFVVTVLNGDVLWTKKDIGRKLSIYEKSRTKRALRNADLITCGSKELIDACIKKVADKNKVCITGEWGVDLTKFNTNGNKAEIRRKLNIPDNFKMVLSPRNIGSLYNLNKIIQAMPKVVGKVKNAYFVFFWGEKNTAREKELKNLASELGVKNAVRFAGYINSDMVPLYHKASDVMVSVSQYDSGPVALKESMACGNVPVISDLPSVREWIKDGWNGILVDPNNVDQIADSIIKLLENDQMRKTFADRNWKLIQEKGDQEYWMGRMEELYYELLKKNLKILRKYFQV